MVEPEQSRSLPGAFEVRRTSGFTQIRPMQGHRKIGHE
jgi:hypothetical protein